MFLGNARNVSDSCYLTIFFVRGSDCEDAAVIINRDSVSPSGKKLNDTSVPDEVFRKGESEDSPSAKGMRHSLWI
jgi:hypothetical protein